MSTNNDGLGRRVAAARQLVNDPPLSARELDRLAGVAVGYASMIESGARGNVGAVVVAGYARVLGTTTDFLILGTGRAPSRKDVCAAVERARHGGNKRKVA